MDIFEVNRKGEVVFWRNYYKCNNKNSKTECKNISKTWFQPDKKEIRRFVNKFEVFFTNFPLKLMNKNDKNTKETNTWYGVI